MMGMKGSVRFRASPACEGGFETRPYVVSLSLCEGEEGVLVWPAGVLQVFLVWLVGAGVPPLSFGHFPRERGQAGWFSDVVPFNEGKPNGFSSPRLRGLDVGPSFSSSVCPRCQTVGPEFGCLSCAALHRSVSPELVL